jgi:hypothetical protein
MDPARPRQVVVSRQAPGNLMDPARLRQVVVDRQAPVILMAPASAAIHPVAADG